MTAEVYIIHKFTCTALAKRVAIYIYIYIYIYGLTSSWDMLVKCASSVAIRSPQPLTEITLDFLDF